MRSEGKKVAPGVKLYLAAASATVEEEAKRLGYWQTLRRGRRHRASPRLRPLHRSRRRADGARRDRHLRDQPELQGPDGRRATRSSISPRPPWWPPRPRPATSPRRRPTPARPLRGTVRGARGARPRRRSRSRSARASRKVDRGDAPPDPEGQPQHRRDLRQGLHLPRRHDPAGDGEGRDAELRPEVPGDRAGGRHPGRRLELRQRLLARAGGDRAEVPRHPAHHRRLLFADLQAQRLQQRLHRHRVPEARDASCARAYAGRKRADHPHRPEGAGRLRDERDHRGRQDLPVRPAARRGPGTRGPGRLRVGAGPPAVRAQRKGGSRWRPC